MNLSLLFPPEESNRWQMGRQLGLDTAVTQFPESDAGTEPWSFDALLDLDERFSAAGYDLSVLEDRPPMDDAILGGPNQEAQIDTVCRLIENMGRVGIDTWCYVWMAPLKVLRTARTVRARGDSLVTQYDHERRQAGPPLEDPPTKSELFATLETFLDRVIPVAEEYGVNLALHPDDPPISPIQGQERIVTSVEDYDRILELSASPRHGITFCQGNFTAMGANLPHAIKHFEDRIHFVHVRDVEGDRFRFTETWHDDGPTDMRAVLKAYREIGFDGAIRPDHVPAMVGETPGHPSRSDVHPRSHRDKGRLYAIGYLRGLLESLEE